MTTPTIIPSNEIAFYEKTTIKNKITGASADEALKTLVQTEDFKLKLDFSKSLSTSGSKVFTYLVPLCPELSWDFVESIHGTGIASFKMNSLMATIPTIKGGIDDLTIAFVPAENLELNPANVNAFVEAVLNFTSGNVTENTINGALLAIAMTDEKFDWFLNFGKQQPLERPETIIGMTGIPTVMVSGTGLKAWEINHGAGAANGTCVSKEASALTYGDAETVPEGGYAISDFPLHVYGAMLIQGTIPANGDEGIFAQWQVEFKTTAA